MTLLSDEKCLLCRGDLATVIHILNHIDPIMRERIPKDMKRDEKEAEIISKEEVKIREVAVPIRVLSIPKVTLQWVDAVTKTVDRRRIEEGRHLKQEVIT